VERVEIGLEGHPEEGRRRIEWWWTASWRLPEEWWDD